MAQKLGGTISLKKNGTILQASGSFTYNLGHGKKEAKVGQDRVHGFTEVPQVPFIEGTISDLGTLSLSAMLDSTGDTITLDLSNGKVIVLRDAWFAGDGNVETEKGDITVRWEGTSAEEIS